MYIIYIIYNIYIYMGDTRPDLSKVYIYIKKRKSSCKKHTISTCKKWAKDIILILVTVMNMRRGVFATSQNDVVI